MLHRREIRRGDAANRGECSEVTSTQAAEIVQPRKIQFEDRRWNIHRGIVTAELEGVITGDDVQGVGPFVARFRAHDRREEFAADERCA